MKEPGKEPKFIRKLRRIISEEAEGRPDAATYEEAGNAALNMVLAHWLTIDSLNPGLVRDEASREVAAKYEIQLQQASDRLAQKVRAHRKLQKENEKLKLANERLQRQAEAGGSGELAGEVHSLRSKVGELQDKLNVALQANSLGVPLTKKQIKARDVAIQAENLRLNVENRDLKSQLAALQKDSNPNA